MLIYCSSARIISFYFSYIKRLSLSFNTTDTEWKLSLRQDAHARQWRVSNRNGKTYSCKAVRYFPVYSCTIANLSSRYKTCAHAQCRGRGQEARLKQLISRLWMFRGALQPSSGRILIITSTKIDDYISSVPSRGSQWLMELYFCTDRRLFSSEL